MHLLREFVTLPEDQTIYLGGALMYYMGIDHHKQYSHITVMNEKGEVIKAEKVWNVGREVKEFLSGLDDEISGVVEAGYSHYTMMDLMESEGVCRRMIRTHP
jgi:hypothetical protein